MNYREKRSYAEIDCSKMRNNIRKVKNQIESTVNLMAVIKGDGYGHSIKASVLSFDDITDWYGVATYEEAISVRNNGSKKPILILGYVPLDCLCEVSKQNLTITLISDTYANAVSEYAVKHGLLIRAHLKIDSGFNRIGFKITTFNDIEKLKLIETYSLDGLNIEGIFTHFTSAGSTSPNDICFTCNQFDKFMNVCKYLNDFGINIGIRHCCNSRATKYNSEYHLDMVRVGMHLYGLGPEEDLETLSLEQVLTWKSKIIQLKEIEIGETVGYSRSYKTEKKAKIAILSTGFADGYTRALSYINEPLVLINGVACQIVGKICMDYMMVDVSDVENLSRTDTAVLLGKDGSCEVSAMKLGRLVKGTAVEVTCQITQRVERIFIHEKL